MSAAKFMTTKHGRKIAYHSTDGTGPGVVFLGGYSSDMTGSKAVFLEEWARIQGRAFLRFDYSGHGESSEEFIDGSIGDWAEDAQAAISELTNGPQILVGSSMGGWISCLMIKRIPEKVAGFVGIAAAPDFTEDSIWRWMDDAKKAEFAENGLIYMESDYEEPYPITRKLVEDGRNHLVLRDPLLFPFPVRLLHGTADTDVEMNVPLRLLDHAQGDDIRLNFVKDADHRFSDERCLGLICEAIESVTKAVKGHEV